jgi:hypothetical protein
VLCPTQPNARLLVRLEVVVLTICVQDIDRLLDLGLDLDLLGLALRPPVAFRHVVEVLGSLSEENPSLMRWWAGVIPLNCDLLRLFVN